MINENTTSPWLPMLQNCCNLDDNYCITIAPYLAIASDLRMQPTLRRFCRLRSFMHSGWSMLRKGPLVKMNSNNIVATFNVTFWYCDFTPCRTMGGWLYRLSLAHRERVLNATEEEAKVCNEQWDFHLLHCLIQMEHMVRKCSVWFTCTFKSG